MKKIILCLGAIAIVSLTACNNSKSEDVNNSTTAKAAAGGVTDVDLSNKGLDGLEITIAIPDSINNKLKFSKSESMSGTLDLLGGEDFKMSITSNWVSEEDTVDVNAKERLSTVKYNIDTLTTRYLVKEPNYMLWEYTTDSGVKAYHFFAVSSGKSGFYSAEDKEGGVYSEQSVRAMLEMARSIKEKAVAAEKP